MRSAVLDAALTYAAAGIRVFPVWAPVDGVCLCGDAKCEQIGKHPMESLVPHGWHDSTLDPATIARWFQNAPRANLGLETARSGLVVLDVDVSGKKRGRESLAEIDSQLPDTLTALTGSDGIHAYYLRPPDLEPFTRIGALPGIDIIGNGYVIAPPSIHQSGKSYRWINNKALVQLPPVLRNLRKAPTTQIPTSEVGAPIVEGGRNNALFRLGAALRATGIDVQAIRAALHLENRRRFSPPLSDEEVDTVAVKVMRHARVERDVALGAQVADELSDLIASKQSEPALWIREVAKEPGKPVTYCSTGNMQLDTLLGGGLGSSMLTGIIGPPSVGKSAYVGTLALQLQIDAPVLSISTELTRPDLAKRYASLVKGWVWRDAIKGNYDAELVEAVSNLSIKLVGTDELDIHDPIGFIVKQALAIRDETGKMPRILLDYVQQLARGEDARAKVGDLTLKLRKMSQLLDTVVIAVFSTSREFYAGGKIEKLRTKNDPTGFLVAAKESGDIEYDCANLIYLDVDQLVTGQPKPARAVVARARTGEPGFAGYRAHLDVGRWVPDPLACLEFVTGGAHHAAIKKTVLDLDDQLVLKAVERNPGKVWRDLRDLCGVSRDRANAARIRLLSSGHLVETPHSTLDENQRQTVRQVLSTAGNR